MVGPLCFSDLLNELIFHVGNPALVCLQFHYYHHIVVTSFRTHITHAIVSRNKRARYG